MNEVQFENTTATLVQLNAERNALNEKITAMMRQQKVQKELEKAQRRKAREEKKAAAMVAAELRVKKAMERLEKLKQVAMNKAIGPVGVKAKRAAKRPGPVTVVEM